MNRIPKKAQRAIDKANQQRLARRQETETKIAEIPVPRMMDVHVTPRAIINLHDVYFNGTKQTLCVYASVDQGVIRRWSSGTGHHPAKDAHVEELQGKVEIRRKRL